MDIPRRPNRLKHPICTVAERLDFVGDHWLFFGAKTKGGYGKVTRDYSKSTTAHRIMWEHHYGTIPKGMQIDHLCRVRNCCNPSHLRMVTPSENMETNTGLNMLRHRANKCWRGHDLSNSWVGKNGTSRHCKECDTIGRLNRKRNQDGY